MARSSKSADRWSSSDKFQMVLEVATLSAEEQSAYCRRQGVYPEQIAQWRHACELANGTMIDAGMSPAAVKAQAKRLAVAANAGLARGLRVSHAMMDGDTIFAASTGRRPLSGGISDLIEIGALAADCLTRAIAPGLGRD